MEKKWIHIIGICGKATSLVAYMFQNMGWFVTGSDIQYFPPASDFLIKHKIPHAQNYSYKHLTKSFWESLNCAPPKEFPDLCLVISTVSTKNSQFKFAKAKNIPVMPMSKILGKYLVKENSIVVAGSSGKTTTTALCAFVLKNLGYDPSFMIGAETLNLEHSIQNTNSQWSVVEGDEYHNPNPMIEGRPKFLEYKPKYLILTNLEWEHHDIYDSFEKYLEAFEKLLLLLPEDGTLVYKYDDLNIQKLVSKLGNKIKARKITFGSHKQAMYSYDFEINDGSNKFEIYRNLTKTVQGTTKLLGEYNVENITSVYALLDSLELNLENYGKIVGQFLGIKKRLEVLFESENLTIIDDFGVAPGRAKRSINTIKKYYPDKKIYVVYDPNSGSRIKNKEVFLKEYRDVFRNVDILFIPELTQFDDNLASRDEMISYLKELKFNVNETLDWLSEIKILVKKNRCIVAFLSSYKLTEDASNLASVAKTWVF